MDILIFIGQSNMQGSTGEKDSSPPVDNGYEYKFLENKLIPLKNPVGEDIGDKLLLSSALGNGSLVPSFCKEYIKNTKRDAVAIHCAKGDSSISEWQKGTDRYNALLDKIKKGIGFVKKNYSIEKVYIVWLQGESDALKFTGTKGYLEMLIRFKNDLKVEFNFDKFTIIRQGHFAEFAPWIKEPKKKKRKSDKDIMKALELAPKMDKDFYMLTRVTSRLSLNKKYLNGKEFGPHYNNLGMKIIGKKAGRKLSKLGK